jgi:hypothetical protein
MEGKEREAAKLLFMLYPVRQFETRLEQVQNRFADGRYLNASETAVTGSGPFSVCCVSLWLTLPGTCIDGL